VDSELYNNAVYKRLLEAAEFRPRPRLVLALEYPVAIQSVLGDVVKVRGDASWLFSAGDKAVLTSELLSTEFVVQGVSYSDPYTSITLDAPRPASDIGYKIAKKRVFTEYLVDGEGRVDVSSGDQFGPSVADQFSFRLEKANLVLNERSQSGWFRRSVEVATVSSAGSGLVSFSSPIGGSYSGGIIEFLDGQLQGKIEPVVSSGLDWVTVPSDVNLGSVKTGDLVRLKWSPRIYCMVEMYLEEV